MRQRVTGHRAVVAVQDAETHVPNGVRLDCAEAGGHGYFAELAIRIGVLGKLRPNTACLPGSI